MRDVVGTLEAVDPTWLTVRRRDGTAERIDRTQVVASKVVAERTRRLRRAHDVDVAELELIAADGWRPLEQSTLGDWLLRASEGFTGRANSVLPMGNPGMPLGEAVTTACQWYTARSLPPQFQLPTPHSESLRDVLLDLGWTETVLVRVLVADLELVRMRLPTQPGKLAVRTSEQPDAEWLAVYRQGEGGLPAVAERILVNADQPLFASVASSESTREQTVAVGRCVVTGSWAGLTAIEVRPEVRRQGLATTIVADLLDQASRRGARHAYVQVAQDNTAALALYARLGFELHHEYSYLRLSL